MKKIALILGLFAFASCESVKDVVRPEPVSIFTITNTVSGGITLTDLSDNAETKIIEWGDGSSDDLGSTENLVSHTYAKDGSYLVKLTAYSKNKAKMAVSSKTAKIDNTMGNVGIYLGSMPSEGYVNFYIDNTLKGQTSKYFTGTQNLTCDNKTVIQSAGVFLDLKPGTYNLVAKSMPNGASVWTKQLVITNGKCSTLRLN